MNKHVCMAMAIIAGMSMSACAIAAAPVNPRDESTDVAALHQLFSRYQQAVADKNAKALLAFYVSGDVPVTGAFAPRSYAVVTAANKQPVPRTMPLTAKDDVVGEAKLPPDQTSNLIIHTDGEVGAVSFDYASKFGHGRIVWSTVLTNDGWKIAAMTYSINVPAADATSKAAPTPASG
jgi:hypothetical protein